jgi:hypothetical protein
MGKLDGKVAIVTAAGFAERFTQAAADSFG